MKKITLQFENGYYGKYDTIKKEIDCEFQAGNANSSATLQIYSIQNSLCFSIFDFIEKIGLDSASFMRHLTMSYKEFTMEEEPLPEHSFTEVDRAISSSVDLDTFTKQFNESEDFRRTVFDIFQDSMEDD